jgi:hypothetical protein
VKLVWQTEQSCVVAMWVAGLLVTSAKFPPWQVEQLPLIPVWFIA